MDLNDLINTRLLVEPLICKHVARIIDKEKSHQIELMLDEHKEEYELSGKSTFGFHFEQYLAGITTFSVRAP